MLTFRKHASQTLKVILVTLCKALARNGREKRTRWWHHTRRVPMPARRVPYTTHGERSMLEAHCYNIVGKVKGQPLSQTRKLYSKMLQAMGCLDVDYARKGSICVS